jgi:UDPglucose--hexose-1-phosphate uridylyltransferase
MLDFDLTSHPHRRFNALSGEWLLVSPHRAKRPWNGHNEVSPVEEKPTYDKNCYLCPTNTRISGDVNPDYKDSFVFTNDFAALTPDTPMEYSSDDELFKYEPVRGTSRVICFSPNHAETIPSMSIDRIRGIVNLWCDQFKELNEKYTYVQIFENKGAIQGCSNPHPHGQIWANSFIPEEITKELTNQKKYFETHGVSLLDAYVKKELDAKIRIVCESEYWVTVVPFWAFWPFETLLLPKFPAQTFLDLNEEQKQDLAIMLKKITVRYDNLFNCSFPYSMGWHNAPNTGVEHPYWTLHAHFYPPLLRSSTVKKFVAGYELLAEKQRDLTPEQAAEKLRSLSEIHYSLNN